MVFFVTSVEKYAFFKNTSPTWETHVGQHDKASSFSRRRAEILTSQVVSPSISPEEMPEAQFSWSSCWKTRSRVSIANAWPLNVSATLAFRSDAAAELVRQANAAPAPANGTANGAANGSANGSANGNATPVPNGIPNGAAANSSPLGAAPLPSSLPLSLHSRHVIYFHACRDPHDPSAFLASLSYCIAYVHDPYDPVS
ncbi:hypothetical protein NUW54_g2862 [Trametes sanguinea]|uniref:Uncharacterized protein n=1 Tax=Trametes sanguinea TaxID=158606 RepID=A0ACC1Q3Q2_9APHY|nr:hypothetical protein NUW54_g2862 [Trametes sanguinea]